MADEVEASSESLLRESLLFLNLEFLSPFLLFHSISASISRSASSGLSPFSINFFLLLILFFSPKSCSSKLISCSLFVTATCVKILTTSFSVEYKMKFLRCYFLDLKIKFSKSIPLILNSLSSLQMRPSIAWSSLISLGVINVSEKPPLPARAVRPTR